jgi:hypothetical protein
MTDILKPFIDFKFFERQIWCLTFV